MRDGRRIPDVYLLKDRLQQRMMIALLQVLYELPRDGEPFLLRCDQLCTSNSTPKSFDTSCSSAGS